MDDQNSEQTISWRELSKETTQRFVAAGLPEAEARWIIEDLSDGVLHELITKRGMARHDDLVARRLAGEPLQYVLGHWSFRTLDLMVDKRVLIPRPETEVVAGYALEELDRQNGELLVADLGTGSGALGLAIAAERTSTRVWCTDFSDDALAVARANLAGLGRPASRVTLSQGSWFEALPEHLQGHLAVIVSNPPYVATGAELPAEVVDWEPAMALTAGQQGTDDLHHLVDHAQNWLAPGGALVLEMSPEQTIPLADRATALGYTEVRIRPDLTGRSRALIAQRP
ncbi:MAG TPA: peptide chain release factor N(5)-glutamine methyltransferase [Acidimicrobiia bacterium]|jgi:release factor glutamine methyltransferase|nr:peptide chain release factor N(5)-glutamine methyltransferase [Acidimicrobiia bacterium]HIL46408.1 peptide chain release factor N(5)-glutamine methyltransferase [Acidimicrobiia bacterium]